MPKKKGAPGSRELELTRSRASPKVESSARSSTHGPSGAASVTSSMEDYLERIHEAIESKGYARAVDIAASLEVQQSSVTKMFQRLDEAGYATYHKYRGLVLTEEGEKLARSVRRRHRILQRLMDLLDLEPDVAFRDVEGIEHHVSRATVDAILDLVEFIERHPSLASDFRDWRAEQRAAAGG